MRKIILSFFAPLLIVLLLVSCNKDRNWVNATVVDSGDITYQGCGYVLLMDDGGFLKPLYLPGTYQHDSMLVKIDYEHTGIRDTCDFGSVVYDMVDLKHIEKRN